MWTFSLCPLSLASSSSGKPIPQGIPTQLLAPPSGSSALLAAVLRIWVLGASCGHLYIRKGKIGHHILLVQAACALILRGIQPPTLRKLWQIGFLATLSRVSWPALCWLLPLQTPGGRFSRCRRSPPFSVNSPSAAREGKATTKRQSAFAESWVSRSVLTTRCCAGCRSGLLGENREL